MAKSNCNSILAEPSSLKVLLLMCVWVLLFVILCCVAWGQNVMPSAEGTKLVDTNQFNIYTLQPVAQGSTNANAAADSEAVGYKIENGQTNLYIGESKYPLWLRGPNSVVELTADGYAYMLCPFWTSTNLVDWQQVYMTASYGPFEPQRFFILP